MLPAFLWSICVIGVTWVIEWLITLAGWTTVLDWLVVRVATFATDTGVIDMIPSSVLSARHTFDLVICQSWIDEEMTAA